MLGIGEALWTGPRWAELRRPFLPLPTADPPCQSHWQTFLSQGYPLKNKYKSHQAKPTLHTLAPFTPSLMLPLHLKTGMYERSLTHSCVTKLHIEKGGIYLIVQTAQVPDQSHHNREFHTQCGGSFRAESMCAGNTSQLPEL